MRRITGVLTGHCPVRYHLQRIGLTEDPTCRMCLEDEETSEHLLCECEALAYRRFQTFGRAVLKPEDIANAIPKDINRFISNLGYLWVR